METLSALGAVTIMATFMGGWITRSPLMVSYELRGNEYVRVKRTPYFMEGKTFLSLEHPLSNVEDGELRERLRESITPGHPLTVLSNPGLFHALEKSRRAH